MSLANRRRRESRDSEDLRPIVKDLDDTVQRIRHERQRSETAKGAERLRHLIAERIANAKLVLVANREPYIHQYVEGGIRVNRPASGLVTGVEPLLKACGGVWVAHGSGSADRPTADAQGRLLVPPDQPEYVLRRIWLTREEEEGSTTVSPTRSLDALSHRAHESESSARLGAVPDVIAVREAAIEESDEHGCSHSGLYFAHRTREIRRLVPEAVSSLFGTSGQEEVGGSVVEGEL